MSSLAWALVMLSGLSESERYLRVDLRTGERSIAQLIESGPCSGYLPCFLKPIPFAFAIYDRAMIEIGGEQYLGHCKALSAGKQCQLSSMDGSRHLLAIYHKPFEVPLFFEWNAGKATLFVSDRLCWKTVGCTSKSDSNRLLNSLRTSMIKNSAASALPSTRAEAISDVRNIIPEYYRDMLRPVISPKSAFAKRRCISPLKQVDKVIMRFFYARWRLNDRRSDLLKFYRAKVSAKADAQYVFDDILGSVC